MNSNVVAVIIVAVIVGIGGFLYVASSPENSDSSQNNASNSSESQPSGDTKDEYTLEEVAQHNSEEDCWTTIGGGVYELTDYISRHPGQDNILSACGVDATEFFNGEKAGQEGDTNDHGTAGRNQLERLRIGSLLE